MRFCNIIVRLSMLIRFGIVSVVFNENDYGCSYLCITFMDGKILEVYTDVGPRIIKKSITLTDAENNVIRSWEGWQPDVNEFDYKYFISAFGPYKRYLNVLLK